MVKFQSFFSITLLIVCTAVAVSARAGREGPGGTGGGDLANSDLLDFSENAGLVEISPENIRGYPEGAEPALKRLEFFIPGFAKDLRKAMNSKKWIIDPRGVIKPQDDHNTISGVLFEGRMAYQDEREIRVNGKLLKSKQIPDAIWGKLIVHEAIRAFSMKLAEPLTEEKLRKVTRLIYAPKMDDNALYDEIASTTNGIYGSVYITRSNRLAAMESAQEVEKAFCSGGESFWRALPFNKNDSESFNKYLPLTEAFFLLQESLSNAEPEYMSGPKSTQFGDDNIFISFMQNRSYGPPNLGASNLEAFIKGAHEFCTRNRARVERLLRLRDDEPTIARLDKVIQKILIQKVKEPEKKQKSVLRSKKAQ